MTALHLRYLASNWPARLRLAALAVGAAGLLMAGAEDLEPIHRPTVVRISQWK